MTPALTPPRTVSRPFPEHTPEQRAMLQAAIENLFEAHQEKDEILRWFLVEQAEAQIVFLAELNGLPREERAA